MDLATAWQLTGRRDGPALLPPAGIVDRIGLLGAPIDVDPLPLLAERAAHAPLHRRSPLTAGGAGRLVAARDGWLAVNLPRPDDLASVAAWLEGDVAADPWQAVFDTAPGRAGAELVERAALLGLPVAALGETPPPPVPVAAQRLDDAPASVGPNESPLVVDLSSLWAGPLATRLLAARGATVVKVESPTRPDGARRGAPGFFAALNDGKQHRAIALDSDDLRDLLGRADVVVEGSRPRALGQHGIGPDALRPRVWASITGHGRVVDRVGFGDDAAVAGGLVAWDGDQPCFVADAVADPLTGVALAVAITDALAAGGRWLIDAALAGVAAWVTGEDRGRPWRAAP